MATMCKYDDLVGLPFRDGGRGPDSYDCWGLVLELFRRRGIVLHDYCCSSESTAGVARLMGQGRAEWRRLEAPEPGCLVAIRMLDVGWANHCGMCLGEGRFIHAYSEETGVVIDRLRRWGPRIAGYYLPLEGAEAR